MSASSPIVIVGAARTPIGGFLGDLKDFPAPRLGAGAIAGAISRSAVPSEAIDEVTMGCVLSAGLGQAPARQAALGARLTESTPCVTVNKMCGSGMKAIMLAHDALLAKSARTVVAGGMESMSNAPYLLDRARSGYRMGHRQLIDHMFFDGLEDAYEKGRLMGFFAEDCAIEYQFTRDMQDEYAKASLSRAQCAVGDGSFEKEIVPITANDRKSERLIARDQLPCKANAIEISKLRPAFKKDGSITAASSSAISDGAAAVVLTTLEQAERHGWTPLATVRGHATHAAAPNKFATAPIGAIKKLMERMDWRLNEVDLFEINEAFAVVALAAIRELDLPRDRVNIHGGACALGHPIGASGARIVVTLVAAMQKYSLRKGVAALCIGGGEATAVAIELLQ
jgi:acetyl-CoA C-acetyltransferase